MTSRITIRQTPSGRGLAISFGKAAAPGQSRRPQAHREATESAAVPAGRQVLRRFEQLLEIVERLHTVQPPVVFTQRGLGVLVQKAPAAHMKTNLRP